MKRPFARSIVISVILTAFVTGACEHKKEKICSLGVPSPIAFLRYGERYGDATSILNGRLISPAGESVSVGTFPLGLAVSPDGRFVAVSNNGAEDIFTPGLPSTLYQSIYVYSVTEKIITAILPEPSLYIGVAFSPDGRFLYAAGGGGNAIMQYSVDSGFAPSAIWTVYGYPTGIFASETRVYVTLQHEHTLLTLDASTGEIIQEAPTGPYPYDVVVDENAGYAYVSNWGADYISIINLTDSASSLTVTVGKNPEGLALSPSGDVLYVACSDEDALAAVSVPEGVLLHKIPLIASPYPGAVPSDVAVTPDGKYVLVTLSGDNAAAVVATDTMTVEGYIPTAYYPSSIGISPDGNFIFVTNARGETPYPNVAGEYIVQVIRGTFSIIPFPSPETLAEYTTAVTRNNNVTSSFFNIPPDCDSLDIPVPLKHGKTSPTIKHVVYIVRENKTYDSYLGDYEKGNGDPDLAVFGENTAFGNVTPNTHALARRFAVCDNFYEEAEQSLQGHIWISLGWINDFMERNWAGMWARPGEAEFFLPGIEPAAKPGNRMLFDHLYEEGISFRIYGDILSIASDPLGKYRSNVNWKYPTWALHVKDVDKARIFIEDLEKGIFPQFVYIWLPNDHTHGLTPGTPTPESMIADNDEAVGMVVDAISHSPFWKETVIFIFEDDPQGTPDHVDVHRSPLLIVSPWVKRGYVSSIHYSFPSIHKTMELILGVQPLSRFDALAAPIYDVFSPAPDTEPYTYIPRKVPESICCNASTPPELVARSSALDFSGPDRSPGLGRILWEYFRPNTPFPEDLADEE